MIIVGLSGVAGVGKDEGAAALVRERGFTRLGFADTLREALYRLNPWIPHAARVQDLVDDYGWDEAKRRFLEIRELLQRMGTEVGRQLIDDQVWVTTLFARAKREGIEKLVIPDVRFPNEQTAVEERGGTVYRIVRPGFAPINAHASDNALVDSDFRIVVHNDSTLDIFHSSVVTVFDLTQRRPCDVR